MNTITSTATSAPPRRIRRILTSAVITIVMLLVIIYLGIGALAASILTTPQRNFWEENTPLTYGLTYQDVRFPARDDKVEIAGWYIPHTESRRAIVIVHGKDGSRSTNFYDRVNEVALGFHQRGFAVLMIDMRGHGQSGDARFSFGLHERRDIEGAVDWLKAQGFQPGSIGILGVSMGAAASIGAAAEDSYIGAVVEDSSYATIYPIIQDQWHDASGLPDIFLPGVLLMHQVMFGYDITSARPVEEVGAIAPRPMLIIHSTTDDFIPIEHARQLKAAAPTAELWEVNGARHADSFGLNPQVYLDKVIGFFEQHLT